MTRWQSHYTHYCHWCNNPYESTKPKETSRFCSSRCKQAHYRAYKKWVTDKSHVRAEIANKQVTPKKRKKRK